MTSASVSHSLREGACRWTGPLSNKSTSLKRSVGPWPCLMRGSAGSQPSSGLVRSAGRELEAEQGV